jgi:hypothetical protein
MTDKTPRGVVLAYLKETVFRGGEGTFASPNITTASMHAFDVLKSPPDPPINYRTREEYWEIGEGRSLARITDLGFANGEASLELGLQTAIMLYYALGSCITIGSSPYYHTIYEANTLPSMAFLYQNNEDPATPNGTAANDINKLSWGCVVTNVTIVVEQGAEITMTVDLMTSKTQDVTQVGNQLRLTSTTKPARFTLKVFTYEDFSHSDSWIRYADGALGTAITSSYCATWTDATNLAIADEELTADELTGCAVYISSGQGKGQMREIESVSTVTEFAVTRPFIVPLTTAGTYTSLVVVYDADSGSNADAATHFNDLIGTSDWTNVDSLEIGIAGTLELRPCVGDPFPAKFVVGKREYTLKLHIYPSNHNTMLTLRNAAYGAYTGPIWSRLTFIDSLVGYTTHALELTHTNLYLSDFPDHIADWDEIIVGIDLEFRSAPSDTVCINSVDDRTKAHYEVT